MNPAARFSVIIPLGFSTDSQRGVVQVVEHVLVSTHLHGKPPELDVIKTYLASSATEPVAENMTPTSHNAVFCDYDHKVPSPAQACALCAIVSARQTCITFHRFSAPDIPIPHLL